jgi:DNA polymerase-3 subunit gamma/tau
MPSYLVLARKYRPGTFRDVVGQDHVVKTLTNSILSGRVAHAFLFCGVRGVGKTTVARILAKALNCSGRGPTDANPCNACTSCREISAGIGVDVQEIDGASHTSVENIREINENIKYPPVSSPYKIIIIDEVHMISINAFNALLKTLEEPPAHAKFIFATTEAHKVPATINSRCQRFNFRTISVQEIATGMKGILEQEGIVADDNALSLVAREAQGSFRDALSLLDQVIGFESHHITVDAVTGILGIAGRDCFGKIAGAILDRDGAQALSLLHELVQQGYEAEQFVLDMIRYLRNLTVVKAVPANGRTEGLIDAAPAEQEEMDALASRASLEDLQNLFGMLMRAEAEIKRSGDPWMAAEMAVLRMALAPNIADLAELVQLLDSKDLGRAEPQARTPQPPREPRPSAKPAPPPRAEAVPRAESAPPPEEPEPEEDDATPPIGFTITGVTPLPTGTPDEVWIELKERMSQSPTGQSVRSIMDHGSLLAFGPTEVEIGFNKTFYKEEFEDKLKNRADLKQLFDEVFGKARLKILVLATETSLHTQKPYSAVPDGQTDLDRALKHEALENPITKAILGEFEDSSVEEISVLPAKP